MSASRPTLETATPAVRPVARVIAAHLQREGAGFVVRRPFPSVALESAGPFLLLDELGPIDWRPGEAVGAPDHPHRGFETVTYVLEGETRHEDSAGHRGTLRAGDVQWMTAGRGVIHSEEPSEELRSRGGRMHGFQLWVNLPAKDKMAAPGYQTLLDGEIPSVALADGAGRVRVIAGEFDGHRGPARTFTAIDVWDVRLDAGKAATFSLPEGRTLALVVLKGTVLVNGSAVTREAQMVSLARDGRDVKLEANTDATVLLLSGEPIDEPIAGYGPFVMNTQEEISQAIVDFNGGKFGRMQ